jgi:methyl-accepting chemotaxis protein
MKPVGKPDAGNPHVRFDERGRETEAACRHRARPRLYRNVQEASHGTQEVSSNICSVLRAANDSGAAATQVLGAAALLSRQADDLSHQVGDFLATVRAA